MDISSLTPDKQVKLQYWLDVIRQCRASGLTNQAWCEQNQISLVSLPDKQAPHSSLAAVLQLGDMRIEIFEDTSSESLVKILKAVQSCQEITPMWRTSISVPGTRI